MGRFAESNPLLDAVVGEIVARLPDFDREVIEDLVEAVGSGEMDTLILGPAVTQVMKRIGLEQPAIDMAIDEIEPGGTGSVKIGVDPGGEGMFAMAMCTCPHCNSQFAATLEQIVKGEKDACPNCGEEIIPGQHPTAGTEPEPPPGVTISEPKVGRLISCPGCNRTVRTADEWCQHCGERIPPPTTEGGP